MSAAPTTTKFKSARPVKHHPQPIHLTSGCIMMAATAAAGFRSIFPSAKAPAACLAIHSVRKALEITKIHDIPKPAVRLHEYHFISFNSIVVQKLDEGR